MGYMLNEDQKDIVKMAHDFCEKEIKPFAAQWDKDGTFPLDTVKKAMEIGYHCLEIPEEFGGSGIDYVTVAAVMEEFAKYDLGFATTLMGTTLSLKPVLMHGTPEQKKMYSDVIVGGGLGAFALTEADAGSDAAATRTTAVKDGNEYVINGSKCFITNSTYADIFVVFALTDKTKGVKGISAFIVERNRPGFSVDKHEDKMGLRSSDTASLVFEDVRIPEDHLLGKEGEGFKYAMQTLDLARPFVGASAVGVAQRCIDEAAVYAKQRQCFGAPIAKLQAIQFKLADMEIGVETARQMIVHTLCLAEAHMPYSREAAIAKCYAADVAFKNAGEAIQILGGYGYSREYPVEKLLRDSKILQIYEGTNEVQRVVISGQVLRRY
ncbi:Acyl-CoA dehydrogenase%2C short-chain specific [uncultured Roseburia sp.]|uniref:Acyl-CoA dehydrogenase family protein n=1 Tax=Brotonthovivens ammoniilytica TaxID=2981725 RepID=A0ABT2TJL6_9FIRM|nr:acyl-CoA dehydrogenase family protein [Brotonthovivens ammoniilytica]MCU6762413.1 acyl-CoA dehydrogenase family protein [Brotonthovivens ammoniilytica]SCI70891.1 Acyl-CoA dehydrogenase%2C short-chain specific [uncultured Roseburia sp.]